MRSGFLLVDKPKKYTSHDVVAKVRRKIGIKKIGHCGTLDPSVTGLLVLAIGREATKQSSFVTGFDKVYFGKAKIGIRTPSQDLETDPIFEGDTSNVKIGDLVNCAKKFEGSISQRPPMFSAVKKNGVPLYKLARKGLNIKREKKERYVHFFKIKNFDLPYFDFDARVSKGTYIRTIIHDMGKTLGCGAALSELRRVQCGRFDVENSHTLDYLISSAVEKIESLIIPADC